MSLSLKELAKSLKPYLADGVRLDCVLVDYEHEALWLRMGDKELKIFPRIMDQVRDLKSGNWRYVELEIPN